MIKAEKICKNYGDLNVLDNLDLHVKSGQFCIITGPSGTGKSTLLNLVNHLEQADEGRILFEGQDTFGKGYNVNQMREQFLNL